MSYLILILHAGSLSHNALNAFVEMQGLGRSPAKWMRGWGEGEPGASLSQNKHNFFHFIKTRTIK